MSGITQAQKMDEGFQMLEKGDFKKGATFFNTILIDYPTNKTARLCYARAIGLSSNPEGALEAFIQMRKEYPNDLEIDLNYAESLLWNKKFETAEVFYIELIAQNPTDFVAHLGYANTLSNLKKYELALEIVNKALEISPNNPGAMVSRKYIKLGYADQKVKQQEYQIAEDFYNEILFDFTNDRDALLNKANLYLITKQIAKGKQVYYTLATNQKDSIVALNGLSLLEHLDDKNKNALAIAKMALDKSEVVSDTTLVHRTQERFVQALIWNKKFKDAKQTIDSLDSKSPNSNWILALDATLHVYKSEFEDAITNFDQILINDSKSFDGNLGIANAYLARGENQKALDALDQTLVLFKDQKDAVAIKEKLLLKFTPVVEEKIAYSFDNGDNKAIASTTELNVPTSLKWSFNGSYQYRTTKNEITSVQATTNNMTAGAQYHFRPKTTLHFNGGITSANAQNSSFNEVLIHSYVKTKPMKKQDLELGYKRELQNFNADLIDKKIAMNNFYLNNNFGTNYNLGWFTQYFFTTQTDNNTRHLLFTSLYYTLLAKPVLKTGLNYQYITFKNQVPNDYFSPSKFHAFEIFVDFLKDEQAVENKGIFYTVSAATGLQYIEDQSQQFTYRFQAKFGYKASNRLYINLYGIHSNIASATAAGFTYTELGLRVKWNITAKPLFKISSEK